MARELADGSIVSFTPDGRFSGVEFDCYRGDDIVSTVSLPFLGWAVVAFPAGDPGRYRTRLLAVGLGEDGEPATVVDIRRVHGLADDQGIRTRLTDAGTVRSLSRIPIDEIIGNFDVEPDPLFADDDLFPLRSDDAESDDDPEEFPSPG
ncbi:hypothetical protein AB0F81_44390 [Actinoplanes sp. NPDC024001]|uniref:hypothetical protein n=1 Tax=Actinoplanes sp. NPDC024001 TaxID=3154598 RepID=UPI00340086C4